MSNIKARIGNFYNDHSDAIVGTVCFAASAALIYAAKVQGDRIVAAIEAAENEAESI